MNENKQKVDDDDTSNLETKIDNESNNTLPALKNEELVVEESPLIKIFTRCRKIYKANSFLILVTIVIPVAYLYPPLGAEYLAPEITATWMAVIFIFLLAGLGLKTDELVNALSNFKFNAFVHIFNFGAVSGIVYVFSRGMITLNVISQPLGDGMLICSCLPLTINMVLVLTKSSGGDEAAAVFNAAAGNMIGVFLTPALVFAYLGIDSTSDDGEEPVSLSQMFLKLGCRVVLPVIVGQILQKFVKAATDFVKKYKPYFKQAQEYCLVFIVYTVFCKTFSKKDATSAGDAFLMIALQLVLLLFVMMLAWVALRVFFPNHPKLRVMGLYGCTHKTVAMGVPLINAMYETNTNVGLYTLPLLVWHPMQLVLGTAIAPRLAEFVTREEKRLEAEGTDSDQELSLELTGPA